MSRRVVLAVTLLAASCTGDDGRLRSYADPPAVSYRVDFGREGAGELDLDASKDRACLALEVPRPRAAHLHWRRARWADDVLVTFFEPPARPRTRACIDGVGEDALRAAVEDAERAYVDLHYGPYDDGLRGSLEQLP